MKVLQNLDEGQPDKGKNSTQTAKEDSSASEKEIEEHDASGDELLSDVESDESATDTESEVDSEKEEEEDFESEIDSSEEEHQHAERMNLEKNEQLKKNTKLNLKDCAESWQYKEGLADLACAMAGRLGEKFPSLVASKSIEEAQNRASGGWASRYSCKKSAPASCFLVKMIEELDAEFNKQNDIVDLKEKTCERLEIFVCIFFYKFELKLINNLSCALQILQER